MTSDPRDRVTLPARSDVVIVGAGPVGLMLANLLGAAGVETVLIERNDRLVGLPRAIAYDSETLRLFAQVGLYDAIADGLIQDPRVVYFNARGIKLMEMHPSRTIYGHSPLGTFYQPSLERVLFDGLARFPNVRVAFGHSVTGLTQDEGGVDLQVMPGRTGTVRARFVVGCDGGNSTVRGAVGVKLAGATYTERWLVIDARIPGHDVDNITFFCDPRRPTVRLPAAGARVRFEFMQLRGESPESLLRDDTVAGLLAPLVKFSEVEIERRVVYAFHARVAERWRSGGVLLAGDAAHLMPPFAGQGMNSGMKDAVNIAWKLAAVLDGAADPTILDSYEAERAGSVRAAVTLSRRLGAIIMPTSRAVALARDAAFACLNLSGRFRSFIARGGVLPLPAIGRSVLTGRKRDPVIGQMIPQPAVTAAAGGTEALDRRLGCHQWMVLGVGTDPAADLSARDRAILRGLGAKFIAINSPAGGDGQRWHSDDRGFLDWAVRHRVRGVLVRPDRFIAERLDAGTDLHSLDAFAGAAARPARAAATHAA